MKMHSFHHLEEQQCASHTEHVFTLHYYNAGKCVLFSGVKHVLYRGDHKAEQLSLFLETHLKCLMVLFEQCDHMTPSDVTADLL